MLKCFFFLGLMPNIAHVLWQFDASSSSRWFQCYCDWRGHKESGPDIQRPHQQGDRHGELHVWSVTDVVTLRCCELKSQTLVSYIHCQVTVVSWKFQLSRLIWNFLIVLLIHKLFLIDPLFKLLPLVTQVTLYEY